MESNNQERRTRSAFTVQYNVRVHPPANTPIKFPKVIYNEDGDYDCETGLFTCKVPGLYYFSFQMQIYHKRLYVKLKHNSSTVLEWFDQFDGRDEDIASGSSLLKLKSGDIVYLELLPDHEGLYGNAVFNGFLLYPD